MQNLFHLLILVLLVGCGTTKKEAAVRPVTDKNLPADRNSSKTYTIREMGITMEVPAGAEYLNWSSDLVTVLAHPLIKKPVSGADYGVTIEGRRILRANVQQTFLENNESRNVQDWYNQFHDAMATKSEKRFTYVRRDILMRNGDVLSMRAEIRSSPKHAQDVEFAKRVIASVK